MNRIKKLISELCPEGVPYRPLDSLAQVNTGTQLNRATLSMFGKYPVMNGGVSPSGFHEEFNTEGPITVISQGGASAGYVTWMPGNLWVGAHCFAIAPNTGHIDGRFLYHFLKHSEYKIQSMKSGAGIPGLSRGKLIGLKCPVPPLVVQREIARILDTFTELEVAQQAELEARKIQSYYYKNSLLRSESAPKVQLGEVVEVLDNLRRPVSRDKREAGEFPYYGANGVQGYVKDFIFDGSFILMGEDGSVINNDRSPILHWVEGKIWVNNHAHILREKCDHASLRYIYYALQMTDVSRLVRGMPPKINQASMRGIEIALPILEKQLAIVRMLDTFTELENQISEELTLRCKQHEYYRSKVLTFDEMEVA